MNEKILCELPERRERFVKHFQMENKGAAAAVYPTPVHFEANGKWEEIDNNLEFTENNGVRGYQNKASAVKITFAESAYAPNMVTIEKDNSKISWAFFREDNRRRAACQEGAKFRVLGNDNAMVQPMMDIGNEKTGTEETRTEETRDEEIKKKLGVPNLVSKGVYEDIYEDMDLSYTIQGERVKEDIKLKSKKALAAPITFRVSHPGLEMKREKDGGLGLFKVSENDGYDGSGKVYEFLKPYMYDAEGTMCHDVILNYEGSVDESRVTIVPDKEWLMAEERVYPVVIDPMTETSKTPDNIEDTYIFTGGNDSSEDPNKVYAFGSVVVGRSNGIGKSRALLRFKNLPDIGKGSIIYAATMYIWQYQYSTYGIERLPIMAHEVTGNWNEVSARWGNQPGIDGAVLDYREVGQVTNGNTVNITPIGFDVTRLVRQWYNTGNNYGIMLRSMYEDDETLRNRAYARFYASNYPQLSSDQFPSGLFYYRNVNGLEDYQSYHEQDGGRSGTGYTNDYTGNVVWIHPDAETEGGTLHASINHVYNSSESGTASRMGYGWRLSCMQELKATGIADYPYVYVDEDGTKHYFYYDKEDGNKLKDEDGLGLTITATTGPDYDHASVMETKDKVKFTFGGEGYLRFIQDQDGNQVWYAYGPNAAGNYCGNATDPTGGRLELKYTSDASMSRLEEIKDSAGRITRYGYDNQGNLTTITYPDGNQSKFTYDSSHKLLSVTDIDQSKIVYQYTTDLKVPRVSRISEKGTIDQLGQELKITYQNGNTTVFEEPGKDGDIEQTADNKKTTYHFDNMGRPTDILDDDGYANNYAYYSEGMKNHKLSKTGDVQKTVFGLLKNSTFDHAYGDGDGWSVYRLSDGAKTVPVFDKGYSGMRSVKLVKSTAASAEGICQETELAPGTYTLSAYVKTTGITAIHTSAGANLMILRSNGTKLMGQRFINYQTDVNVDEGWERLVLTFKLSVKEKVSAFAGIFEATGTLWVSGMQLETGETANKLNLINNPGFEFAKADGGLYAWGGSRLTGSGVVMDPEKGRCMFIRGDITQNLNCYQAVNITGKEGDIYKLSCWVKGTGMPGRSYTVSAAVIYEGNTPPKWHHFECNPNVKGWQFVSGTFSTDDENNTTHSNYVAIHVYVHFNNQANQVLYKGMQLIKDDGESYVYDSDGNLTNAVSAAEKSHFTYDRKSNITMMGNVDGTSFESAYDGKGHLKTAKSSEGVRYTFDYDAKGNPTGMTVEGGRQLNAVTPGRTYYVREKVSGHYLDLRDGNTQPGTIAQLYEFNGTPAQKWRLVSTNDGYYNLISEKAPSLCLDLANGTDTENNAVQVYTINNSDAQKWRIHPNALGGCQISCKAAKNKRGLTNNGSKTENAHPVTSCTLNEDYTNQQWYFEPADEGTISDVPKDGDTFYIRVRQTGQYLDIEGISTAAGTRAMQSYYNGGKNQQFRLVRYDSQYYYLEPLHAPGMVVAKARKNSAGYDALALVKKSPGDVNQLFQFKEVEPGKGTGYLIECKGNEVSLDVMNFSYAAGTDIILTQRGTEPLRTNKWWILESCGQRMESSMTYTSDGRNIASITNARGYVTRNEYDEKNRLLKKTVDARGNALLYSYDANTDQLTEVKQIVGGQERKINYTYEKDQLMAVSHNGFSYNYVYDIYGNKVVTKVGAQMLEMTEYENRNGQISSVTYGNGNTILYQFNKENQLISQTLISARGEMKKLFTNTYDNYGNLVSHQDLRENVRYDREYDLIGRVIALNTSKNQVLRLAYDDKNRVEAVTQKIDQSTVKTSYLYGDAAKQQKPGLFYGLEIDGTKRVSYAYDQLARLRKRTLHLTNGVVYETTYDCLPGAKEGTTTALVTKLKNGADELAYTYDANGNIQSITENGTKRCTYFYDEMNELIRENNLRENKTICYTYDKGGNLTARKEYAYTEGSPATLTKQYSYAYTNANWKDQLTSYEGQAITYDELGNPLSYRGMAMTWEKARELKQVVKGGKTFTYSYNSDGVRTGKTVDGVTTTYYLNENTVMGMKKGNDLIHYIYDQDDTLVMMKLNGKEYYYVHNVQGDVVGLVDSTGTQVVSYSYDSWGRLLSMTDGTADKAGTKNPFRYREYCWDDETGLYYLNSRYYDPAVGRFINADDPALILTGEIAPNDKNLYAYCDNNPVARADDAGEFWNLVAGAIIGGVISGGLEVAAQLIENKGTNKKLNIENIIVATVGGAVGGALSASVIGRTGQKIGNALIGAVSEGYTQIREKKSVKSIVKNVAGAAVIGWFAGEIGGSGTRSKDTAYGKAVKNLKNYSKRAQRSGLRPGIKVHKAKSIVKRMRVPVTIAATKSFTLASVFSVTGNRFKVVFK